MAWHNMELLCTKYAVVSSCSCSRTEDLLTAKHQDDGYEVGTVGG